MTTFKVNDVLEILDCNSSFDITEVRAKAIQVMTQDSDPRKRRTHWLPISQLHVVRERAHPDAVVHETNVAWWLIKEKELDRQSASYAY